MIGVRPNDVALRTEAGGRPVMRDGGTGIHFSLSRSDERVLIGVSASPLGVDLEWLGAPIDVDALAETIFSPRERLVFGQTPPERRREIFLRCWTWKEAILKATGQGLSIPPAEAEVLLTPGSVTRTEAVIVSLGARWKVLTVPPRTGFVGAVAAALEPLPFAFAHGSGPVSCRLAGAPLD
jgi:4'-phosphopantetheinyl transferase